MRQSPSAREAALCGCGAAHTKAIPPRVAIAARAAMRTAESERCIEPPCSDEKRLAQELERGGQDFLQGKRIKKAKMCGLKRRRSLNRPNEAFSRADRPD